MSTQSNTNVPALAQPQMTRELTVFSNMGSFQDSQRMAMALSSSKLVPQVYQGDTANCLVALEMAQRTGAGVMAVMQNLHIIHGRPSWSSSYIIAALNSCGRFSSLQFRMEGEGKTRACTAWAKDRDGNILESPTISMAMAEAEGWVSRTGSKWKTMPDLMLRYRAAAFFGRLYAPEILMGMKSEDEIIDVTPIEAEPVANPVEKPEHDNSPLAKTRELNAKIRNRKQEPKSDEAKPDQTAAAPAGEAPGDEPAKQEFF